MREIDTVPKFRDADERIAWDRFVAGALAKGCGWAIAAEEADELIGERRKRDDDTETPAINQATDGVDKDGWNAAGNLDRVVDALERLGNR
jgi:hypothetical protein